MSNKLSVKTRQELIIVKENQQLVLAKQMIQHKPRLAVIVDNKKIKEYLPAEIVIEQENIVNYLMAIIGISAKDEIAMKHVGMVGVFISEEYNNYAYEEIKEAFKLAMKGAFDGYNMIYKLDCKVLSEVMSRYDVYKRKQLRVYRSIVNENLRKIKEKENMPTDEQNELACINGIKKCYKHHVKTGRIDVGNMYLYRWLFKKNLMPKDKPTVNAIKKEATARFETRKKLSRNKKEAMMYNVFERGKETVSFSNLCREISLEEFFKKFKTEEQMINFINK